MLLEEKTFHQTIEQIIIENAFLRWAHHRFT